jgi:hypothetical protein
MVMAQYGVVPYTKKRTQIYNEYRPNTYQKKHTGISAAL